MSALDNLSVASNVLQVIGFADTVFHAGKTLYELFDKARSASRNIALLLLELQALLSVVAFVHVVITEHAASPFAQDDGHTLPNVHTILTLIEQDFLHLRGLIGQTVRSRHEGWLSLLQSNVRWALKDHDIAAARHRLARYTQNLNAALSVSGRRNDIVLRTKLQDIEDRLHAISQTNPPQLPSPGLDTQPPASKRPFRVPRRQLRVTSTQMQPRISAQSGVIEVTCTSGPVHHRKDNVIALSTTTLNNSHIQSIDHAPPKINVNELDDHTLCLDAGNYALHQITKSAILLRDSLIASFDVMRTGRAVSISQPQIVQLQMLFDFLIASAHTASAEYITNKYNNSSRTKPLDRSPSALNSHDTTSKKRGINFSNIDTRSLPYLVEKNLELDTIVGFVNAKILSARSIVDSKTLAFIFQYYGNGDLSLSPFAVDFVSHELTSYCQRVSGRAGNNRGLELSHVKLFDVVQSFLPPLWTTMYGADYLMLFASEFLHQWGESEMTIWMSYGWMLPRIPIKAYEFSTRPDTSSLVQYQINSRTCARVPFPSPSLVVYMNHHADRIYNQYINDIVDNYLEDFGETCWADSDNDFPTKLFRLMTRVRPRGKDEAGLLREAYRLIVVTFIMGHVITIAEETKESALFQMRSYTGPGTYAENFCSPRLANRQLKYYFFRLQASIFTDLLFKLQKFFGTSYGYDKWVPVFIAVLGIAMASEYQQKTIHYLIRSKVATGLTTEYSAQILEHQACRDIDAQFDFIQTIFQWKYRTYTYNPLRGADIAWDEKVGITDENEVNLLRGVASLTRTHADFLADRASADISSSNVTMYAPRLVARFLLSFWLPE